MSYTSVIYTYFFGFISHVAETVGVILSNELYSFSLLNYVFENIIQNKRNLPSASYEFCLASTFFTSSPKFFFIPPVFLSIYSCSSVLHFNHPKQLTPYLPVHLVIPRILHPHSLNSHLLANLTSNIHILPDSVLFLSVSFSSTFTVRIS